MQKQTQNGYFPMLITLEKNVFSLEFENIDESVGSILNLYDHNYPYSFFYIICRLVYSSFISQRKDINIYFDFLKAIDKKFQDINNYKIFYIFIKYLLPLYSQESDYILENMINQKLANVEIVTKPSLRSLYFIHHLPKRDRFDDFKHKIIHSFTNFYQPYYIFSRTKQWFLDNITEIKENDWELHKQYIKEGHNPNEITKIIRNDEIEKLQEISSQNDFNFNQYIIPSHYERCSFINKKNVTLIDYAAFFGSVKCFKYLLMNGAKVENTGKYAVAGGNEEIIHLCEQNHSSFYGSYETAIEFHRNDIFKYLYENKIIKTLDIKDLRVKCILYDSYKLLLYIMKKEDFKFNEFAIYESSHIGNIFLVKYFIGGHLIPKNILFPCAFSGNIELFRYVLENNEIDIDAKNQFGETPLILASKNGNTEICKLIIEKGKCNINTKGEYGKTALIYAATNGFTEIVKLLLEQKGIDINAKEESGYTALICASSNGYTEIVKLLLEQKGIDINVKDRYVKALILSSQNGHTETVKLLLEQKGIDINAKEESGKTALIYAATNGFTEIVKLLLEQKGIDINVKDKNGKTALIYAATNGFTEIVKLLLEQKGINLNAKNRNGVTPLIYASWKGHTEIVKLLLEKEGINLNAKDKNGITALIYAATNGYTEIVKLLINQEGINLNVKDRFGDTPLIISLKNDEIELSKLLIEHKGIDVNIKNNIKNSENYLKFI